MRRSLKGFTLVEIMIVVAIIALLAAVAIPNLLRAKISANESSAQSALKSIANSIETYSITNGTYPAETTSLVSATPPYLNKDFFVGTFNGYVFTATLSDYTYSITAVPASSSQGTSSFTITTGAVLTIN